MIRNMVSAAVMPVAVGFVVALCAPADGAVIIETQFVADGSTHNLSGSTTGLTTNLPGANWVNGAGWNWNQPYLKATWSGGVVDSVDMGEEKAVLGISIASAGAYTKPTSLSIEADFLIPDTHVSTIGLGFDSAVPPYADYTDPFTNFTGLAVAQTGSIQLYVNGAASGSPVAISALTMNTTYHFSYDVDLTSGDISNIVFDGNPVADITTTAFTDAATTYATYLNGYASRSNLLSLTVAEAAAATPEPGTLAVLGLGALGLAARRRRA